MVSIKDQIPTISEQFKIDCKEAITKLKSEKHSTQCEEAEPQVWMASLWSFFFVCVFFLIHFWQNVENPFFEFFKMHREKRNVHSHETGFHDLNIKTK